MVNGHMIASPPLVLYESARDFDMGTILSDYEIDGLHGSIFYLILST